MWASKLLGIIGGTLLCSLLDYVGHVTKALHPLLVPARVAIGRPAPPNDIFEVGSFFFNPLSNGRNSTWGIAPFTVTHEGYPTHRRLWLTLDSLSSLSYHRWQHRDSDAEKRVLPLLPNIIRVGDQDD
jgi:hypothetical protein